MCTDDALPLEVLLHLLEPPRAQENVTPAEYIIDGNDNPKEDEFEGSDPLAYEAAEHQATAEGLKLTHVDGFKFSSTKSLVTVIRDSTSVNLTFGRIIALAGDFYTNREHKSLTNVGGDYPPICGAFYQSPLNPTKRFQNAVNSLLNDEDEYLSKITELLNQEHNTVSKARDLGKSVSGAYHTGKIEDHFEPDNCKIPDDEAFFNSMIGHEQIEVHGHNFKLPYPVTILYNHLLSMYAWLAYTNADHFGEDAVKVYCIGHALALRIASQARDEDSKSGKWEKLKLAYIYEAFAAHYLTDLFSSGHLRAPRRFLHASNSWTMARATIVKHKLLGSKPEVPIWDHQQRYMHDDDCATGLLVRNEHGDEWIAYGDKQFFEAKNAVNRSRAAYCLQTSVNEVYNKGFKDGFNPILEDNEDSWKVYRQNFDAVKLLPLPMTACLSTDWVSKWGNYDMHNPAPLWVAGEIDDHGHVPVDSWTLRKDVNDHSNFKRAASSPAEASSSTLTASDECVQIRDAPFRGDDQFAPQNVMKGLLSGGFVQVQDLAALQKGAGTCINFWNPVSVEIGGVIQEAFTIRNRLIDIATPAKSLSDQSLPVHWSLRNNFGHGGTSTYLAGFYWIPGTEGAKSAIAFYETEFCEKVSSFSGKDIVFGGKRIKFDHSKSWKMDQKERPALPITLSRDLPSGYAHANTTRFLVDRLLPGDSNSPDFAAVTALSENNVQIAVCNPDFEPSRKFPFNTVVSLKSQFKGFAKALKTSKTRKSLLLVNASYQDTKSTVDFYEYSFERQQGVHEPKIVDNYSHLECPLRSGSSGDASVLVGDVLGQGNDQVVVVSGHFDDPEMRFYARPPGSSLPTGLTLSGRNIGAVEYEMELVRPYLSALVPSCTGKGLDVLQISLRQKKNGSKHLFFHTHVRSAHDATNEKAVIWDKCRENSVYDALASSKNGQYFHIKFIRTTREVKDDGDVVGVFPAILEIFSWYGVLGVRLFAAGPDGWDYEWCGQQPYLGQTSIGAGLGSSGDWGNGFLTWASDDEWVDVNVFKPKSKDNLTEGTWSQCVDDLDKEHVRGYDIERRPLR